MGTPLPRDEILHLGAKYGAHNVRLFGSAACGETDEASDLDLVVELERGRSPSALGGLRCGLEALLGCRVEVVTGRGLRRRTRDRVLREAAPV